MVFDFFMIKIFLLYGFIIGFISHTLLYITVNWFNRAKSTHMVIVGYFIRIILVMLLLYMLMDGDWKKLLLMSFGYFISRIPFALYYMMRSNKKVQTNQTI